MDLEDITLSEMSQPQEDKYCIIPLISSQSHQNHRDRKCNGGCQGEAGAGRNGELLFNVSVLHREESSGDARMVMVTWQC